MTALSRSAVLTNYLEVARHLQLNVNTLLADAGLSVAILSDPTQQISVSAAIDLLEQSAKLSNCETFGLRMAELRQLSDFGEVSLLLSHQKNLRDALQVIVQYRHLLNDSLAIFIEETGKTVIIREELVTESGTDNRQAIELAIGIMHRFCAALLGAHWQPMNVCFTHEAPADLTVHRRIFGCKIEFGCEFNGIVCPSANLDTTNPLANEAMARHAQRYLDSLQGKVDHSLAFDVRKSIYLLLPMGRATIEQIAQSQGMNVRTLQRRLDEEGASFSDLINGVRRDLVIRYLENPYYSLGQITDILGYSMPSSFTRWFISQFGMPPASWRKAHNIAPRKEG
ncbi:MAG: AraC family transcriptional regulator [Pseudomonadaceae bacterium]|mgnify:CR=1 FL=1|uniref:AraC family transcriptional regulator n=1 Tax=Pseudomonas sp. MS19 TaxID=2579939 RepID=UPI000C11FE28|nr:AraC family transcriptional regulator [Pseudomonas sp. MS19]MBQ53440.1 AraC family transcriptional regulator [Pseudomonadaceae bacterium]NRH26593.1 AraC family transcriptional regulator [Pseudomonas sp. MS19]HCP54627.1 AraC family transcriptional regulator [Pseudomonas sp.]